MYAGIRPLRGNDLPWEQAGTKIEPQVTADGIHIWPFDEDFPIDVRFLEFGRQPHVRLRRHDYLEVFYQCSGKAVWEIRQRSLESERGALVALGNSLYHRIRRCVGPSLRGVVLYFLPRLILGDTPGSEEVEYLAPLLDQDETFPHVIAPETGIPERAYEWVMRIHEELPARSNRARLAVKTYLRMLLYLLVEHYESLGVLKETGDERQRSISRLQPLFEFMDRHYGEKISVERAAAVLNMSRSRFMHFFRNTTGQSFVTYLTRFRIARAEWLLENTGKSISEISYEVGFCDQSYFSQKFRELTHMSPSRYRNHVRGLRSSGFPGPATDTH